MVTDLCYFQIGLILCVISRDSNRRIHLSFGCVWFSFSKERKPKEGFDVIVAYTVKYVNSFRGLHRLAVV